MTEAARAVDRVLKQHRKWLQNTFERIVRRETKNLDSDLAQGTVRSLVLVANSLSALATGFGIKAVVGLAGGDPSSWSEVDHAAGYWYWSLQLHFTLFQKVADVPNLTPQAGLVACTLCYALANERGAWSAHLAEMLAAMDEMPGTVAPDYWESRVFEPFARRLQQVAQGMNPAEAAGGRDLGPYQGILTRWQDDAAFPAALAAVCDYHAAHMEDQGEWDPEFDHPPFDLVPWEVWAIIRVRERGGLRTPVPQHPLTSAPWVPPAGREVAVTDPVLARVESAYRQQLAAGS